MKTAPIHTFALLPLLLLGCDEALEPGSKVDSFRVLAEQADLPYAHPGETVQLTSLSHDPQGRGINWAWASGEPRARARERVASSLFMRIEFRWSRSGGWAGIVESLERAGVKKSAAAGAGDFAAPAAFSCSGPLSGSPSTACRPPSYW